MPSSSVYSNGLPPRKSNTGSHLKTTSSFSDAGSAGGFQMMDITVSVLGLTGIIMHTKKGKDYIKDTPKSSISQSGSFSADSVTSQSCDEPNIPIAALASFYKNVTNSETTIASHIPSLPLRTPSSDTSGDIYRYTATWPTDFDPSGNELSTFQCSRLMRREHPSRQYIQRETGAVMGFVPEKVQLKIGLRQGSEIITLGSAMILITGEESDDIHVSLPINTIKQEVEAEDFGGGKLKKSRSKIFGKSSSKKKKMKPISFTKDHRRKYTLDHNSYLSVLIRVSPSDHQPKCQASSKENSNPLTDYNSVPEVLHVSNESDSCSGSSSLSNSNFIGRKSRSVKRYETCPEEEFSHVKQEMTSPFKNGSRLISSTGSHDNRSESCIQHHSRSHSRSSDNNNGNPKDATVLREIRTVRSYNNCSDEYPSVGVNDRKLPDRYQTYGEKEAKSNRYHQAYYQEEEKIHEQPVTHYPNCSNQYHSRQIIDDYNQNQFADEIRKSRSDEKNETNIKHRRKSKSQSNADMRVKKNVKKTKSDQSFLAENKALFFASSIFRCGDMMNVLNENSGKVSTKEVRDDKNYSEYKEGPIPSSYYDSESDGNALAIAMRHDHPFRKSRAIINYPRTNCEINENNYSLFEIHNEEETQIPDEYTCATEPTQNRYQGERIMKEDKARNTIDNYANRVGVHPTKMV